MTHNSASPILPVGRVNLLTGKNAEWGTVWNLWPEDPNETYLLVRSQSDETKFRAIITCSPMANATKYNPVGDVIDLQHDQTGATIGTWRGWKVVGLFENSPAGLRKMADLCGQKSIPFATFK
jgi:hypothetical protein